MNNTQKCLGCGMMAVIAFTTPVLPLYCEKCVRITSPDLPERGGFAHEFIGRTISVSGAFDSTVTGSILGSST